MQKRHLDRDLYFTELAKTSKEFYIDYVNHYFPLKDGCRVLEVGCGDGGNLLPFAEIGCKVTGIDRSEARISRAESLFRSLHYKNAEFIATDFFDYDDTGSEKFDIILVHDVIEHITQKDKFAKHIKQFVTDKGIIFWRFPAWQMPFGGHQQICKHKICSKLPFIHLLPTPVYRVLLSSVGESPTTIDELIDIKECKTSIERFEKLMKDNHYSILDRQLWFINPHYKQKFNLRPRKLFKALSHITYIRNFFTTSCYYITQSHE